ncbi:uncharacterized protein LOC130445375 isoform X2 [Diorhabda sublineata]|uniref:uncharacterized protein LOC130445375 isoform X2 n=1 Tax=Diorhabda sublineata TaxID=1163346 RepID=UPI0024E17C7A|nr:uncharacterized protein LOC130445375 isoform X2 [Diorhabda sublineata]
MAHNLKFTDAQQMDILRKMNAADLIQEVEKYPLLYDNKYPNHTQLTSEMKKKTWEIIAEKLYGQQRWESCNEVEREAIAKEIQFKWKNLKDNFMRILKKEKDDEDNGIVLKRKKYIYYDLLSFLKPFAPFAKKNADVKEEMELGGKNASNIIYINETKDELEEETLLQMSSPPPITPKPVKIPPSMNSMPSFGTLQPVQLIQLQPNNLAQNVTKDDGAESTNQKLAQVLEQMAHAQDEEKTDDPMGNKKFLMSLVPFMRKLPDDVNLEVRLQLMSVLQSYVGKDVS